MRALLIILFSFSAYSATTKFESIQTDARELSLNIKSTNIQDSKELFEVIQRKNTLNFLIENINNKKSGCPTIEDALYFHFGLNKKDEATEHFEFALNLANSICQE